MMKLSTPNTVGKLKACDMARLLLHNHPELEKKNEIFFFSITAAQA